MQTTYSQGAGARALKIAANIGTLWGTEDNGRGTEGSAIELVAAIKLHASWGKGCL